MVHEEKCSASQSQPHIQPLASGDQPGIKNNCLSSRVLSPPYKLFEKCHRSPEGVKIQNFPETDAGDRAVRLLVPTKASDRETGVSHSSKTKKARG
jgi:hypothetical protein